MNIFKKKTKEGKILEAMKMSGKQTKTIKGCKMSTSGKHNFIHDSKMGSPKCVYCGMVDDK